MESTIRHTLATALAPLLLAALLVLGVSILVAADPSGQSSQDQAPQVSIVPADVSVSRCGTFSVTVWAEAVTDLGAYEFKLDWDPAILTVTHVADGGFLGATGREVHPVVPEIDPITATLSFAAASDGEQAGVDGAGPLATIVFEAVGVGVTPLHLHGVILADVEGDPLAAPTLVDGVAGATREAVRFELGPVGQQVAGQPFDLHITALDADGLCAPDFAGPVTLSDPTGTLAPALVLFSGCELTATVSITAAWTGATILAEGENACGVAIDGESAPFDVVADEESPISVTIAPAVAAVVAGESVTYTLTAADPYGNPFDVTPGSAFTVTAGAGGSWTENVYTSQNQGTWDVIGAYHGLSDTAQLTVMADADYPVSVSIEPLTHTVTAGESVTYTLTAADGLGNTWDVTADADFAIDAGAGGSWAANVYTSQRAGSWPVTAAYAGLSDEALLTVEPDEENPTAVVIAPATATVTAGDALTYTLSAQDGYGNAWDVTPAATFSVEGGAGGAWAENVYTSDLAGTWAVTGTYGALYDVAQLTVVEACAPVSLVALVSDSPVRVGEPIHFTATLAGTGPFTYLWDFGDGGVGSGVGLNTATPSWTYVAAGAYTVTLTVENPCGADEMVTEVMVELHRAYLPLVLNAVTTVERHAVYLPLALKGH